MPLVSYNSVGGFSTGLTMTGVIDSLGNITGVGATFSGLIRANAGISASGATFSGAVNIPLNTAPALKIGTHGTKDLVLSSTDGAGLIEQGGAGSATLQISQASGGTVRVGGTTNFVSVVDSGNEIRAQTIGILYLGDADGANNGNSIVIDDTVSTIVYAAGTQHTFYGTASFANGLLSASLGISAAGGVTFAGTLKGTTAAFTGLVSSTIGFSGSGTNLTNIVKTFNGLSGGVTLAAGTNITLTPVGNTITINSSGGGGGGSSVYTVNDTLDFSETINGYYLTFSGVGLNESTSLQYVENNKTIVAQFNTAGEIYDCTLDSIKSFYDPTNGWSVRLVVKPPFINTTTLIQRTAQWLYDDGGFPTVVDLNITSASGTNTIDSWDTVTNQLFYHQEETYVTKTLTGITWVTDSMFLSCKVLGLTSADHTPEDAILEGVNFEINNILGGTGFDIIGHAPEGTYGKYTIKCLGQ